MYKRTGSCNYRVALLKSVAIKYNIYYNCKTNFNERNTHKKNVFLIFDLSTVIQQTVCRQNSQKPAQNQSKLEGEKTSAMNNNYFFICVRKIQNELEIQILFIDLMTIAFER